MYRKALVAILATFALFTLTTPSAFAASQDECAIWICLPSGFGEGCSGAKSAMKDRVEDHKSPIPSFRECSADDGSDNTMGSDDGYAAYIPERRVCTNWKYYNGKGNEKQCSAYKTLPSRYVHHAICRRDRDGNSTPAGCSGTVRFAEVYVNGELAGPTYYFK